MFGSTDTETAVLDGFSEQVRDLGAAYYAVCKFLVYYVALYYNQRFYFEMLIIL
jgi:hypothetical protein